MLLRPRHVSKERIDANEEDQRAQDEHHGHQAKAGNLEEKPDAGIFKNLVALLQQKKKPRAARRTPHVPFFAKIPARGVASHPKRKDSHQPERDPKHTTYLEN